MALSDLITQAYSQYLGRSPDQEGYNNWLNYFGNAGISDPNQIAPFFQNSVEGQAYGASHPQTPAPVAQNPWGSLGPWQNFGESNGSMLYTPEMLQRAGFEPLNNSLWQNGNFYAQNAPQNQNNTDDTALPQTGGGITQFYQGNPNSGGTQLRLMGDQPTSGAFGSVPTQYDPTIGNYATQSAFTAGVPYTGNSNSGVSGALNAGGGLGALALGVGGLFAAPLAASVAAGAGAGAVGGGALSASDAALIDAANAGAGASGATAVAPATSATPLASLASSAPAEVAGTGAFDMGGVGAAGSADATAAGLGNAGMAGPATVTGFNVGPGQTAAAAAAGLGSQVLPAGNSGGFTIPGTDITIPSNVLSGALQAGLGYAASNQQSNTLQNIYDTQRADRAPALAAYNNALANPDTFYNSAPAMGAADATLRRLSMQGNPANNPGLLSQAAANSLGGYNNYLASLAPAAFGGQATQAQLGTSMAGAQGGGYEALGAGVRTATQSNPYDDYIRMLTSQGNRQLQFGGV